MAVRTVAMAVVNIRHTIRAVTILVPMTTVHTTTGNIIRLPCKYQCRVTVKTIYLRVPCKYQCSVQSKPFLFEFLVSTSVVFNQNHFSMSSL